MISTRWVPDFVPASANSSVTSIRIRLSLRRPGGVTYSEISVDPAVLNGSKRHPLRFRSTFGDLELRSPRWYECACEGRPAQATFSPLKKLLTTHTAPELEFLRAKWAAHLSFGAVADLLHDVLPIDARLNDETIRMQVLKTAERLEAELGPEPRAPSSSRSTPDASLRSKSRRNPDRPSLSAWTAATSVVESGVPVGPDALRSLPARVFPKKARPKCLRGYGESIRNPSVD